MRLTAGLTTAPLMNSARKTLSLLVATLASLGSPSAKAAGLGELVARSSLGEPLRAEILLVRTPGEELDASCFRRVGNPGRDDIPWIGNARVRLNGDRLIVTTREAVNHPIAMLGVQVTCGTELRRDYPILLPPPLTRISSPIVESAPVFIETPSEPPVVVAQARSASRLGPRNIATEERPPAKPQRAPRREAAARPQAEPPRHDRLILGFGDEANRVPLRMSLLLANPPSGDEADGPRQQLRQEQRTLTEIDDRIAAQLEVNEKIKRLEEYQALLKERVAQLDDTALPPAAAVKPVASPVPVRTSGPEGILAQVKEWAFPLAGVLAVLLGGGALIWLRRRRPAEPVEAMEPTTQPDFRISAPPSTTDRALISAAHEEARAMPPVQHAVVPPPADNSGEWAEPTFAPAHPIPFDETVDEQDSALELAEIMMSFGRTQGAAETLADYIRNNPRQAVKPWLKLLEVYHVAGMRAEFEVLTRQLNKTFNVKMISWNDFSSVRSTLDTVEQIPHVCQRLQEQWGTQEAQIYIHQILRDNRNGTRQGFPLSVVEELLLLLAILDEELGTYKPAPELTLAEMTPAPQQAAQEA